MNPFRYMLVLLGLIPILLGVMAYLVLRDVYFLYAGKNPAIAVTLALFVVANGIRDTYRLFYSGLEADPPEVHIRRVLRAYFVVPVAIGVTYVLSHLLELDSAWPAIPVGIVAFIFVRIRLRSPIIEQQEERSRPQ